MLTESRRTKPGSSPAAPRRGSRLARVGTASARDLERGADVGGIQGRRDPTGPPAVEPAAQCSGLIAALVLASGQVDEVDAVARIVSLPPVPDGPGGIRYRAELRPFACLLSPESVRDWTALPALSHFPSFAGILLVPLPGFEARL